jgi:hypothetical protein
VQMLLVHLPSCCSCWISFAFLRIYMNWGFANEAGLGIARGWSAWGWLRVVLRREVVLVCVGLSVAWVAGRPGGLPPARPPDATRSCT